MKDAKKLKIREALKEFNITKLLIELKWHLLLIVTFPILCIWFVLHYFCDTFVDSILVASLTFNLLVILTVFIIWFLKKNQNIKFHIFVKLMKILATKEEVTFIKNVESKPGFFNNTNVQTEWLQHHKADRSMRLLNRVTYTYMNTQWIAPKERYINGASIPKIFWIAIGPPFVGNYRRATIIHDIYCEDGINGELTTISSDSVHEMFFHAMLSEGVEENKAVVMFLAVKFFGPQW